MWGLFLKILNGSIKKRVCFMTISFGLLGAGRIGKTHATAILGIPGAKLTAVYDPVDAAAEHIVKMSGARRASVDEILADKSIHAVLICTPTDMHADQIELAAKAGKAIFCEKPVDLSAERVRACLKVVEATKTKLIAAARHSIDVGDVGTVELVQIVSRDPGPPPLEYIKRSGGLFRDMMIHDLDLARFLLNGEEIVSVSATGSVLVDSAIGEAGDVDTATATLRSKSGKIVVITNSRRATYGYDQRIEIHGSKGAVSAANVHANTVTLANVDGYREAPLLNFFMERYADAYRSELQSFVTAIETGSPISPSGLDGLKALELADACVKSMRSRAEVVVVV
jgi:myo-inositol 2-dehydrogenase/D-chiro-inositol 1-dehydrogenase